MGNTIQVDHDAVISEPLVFHDVHAESIEITNNRRRAHRVNGLQGMCFSQRPILQNELVCLRIAESLSSKRNKGGIALRFGYTAIDPSAGNLRTISDLASAGHGYWVKAVADSVVKRGVAIFFYLSESGEVIYGRKDKDYGVLFSGVRTGVPLWVVIDMSGSALTLEFLDGSLGSLKTEASKKTQVAIAKFESRQPQKSTKNTLSRSSDGLSSSSLDAPRGSSNQSSQNDSPSGNSSMTRRQMSMPFSIHQLEQNASSSRDEEDRSISTQFEQLIDVGRSGDDGSTRGSTRSDRGGDSRPSRRSRRHSSLIPSLAGDPNIGNMFGSAVNEDPAASTTSAPNTGAEFSENHHSSGNLVTSGSSHQYPRRSTKVTEPMLFHAAKIGRNVMLSEDRLTATRRPGEFSNAYVFTENPLLADDELVLKIAGINDGFIGGLTIGLTTCNPSDMRQVILPDDPHQLLDRPEYWVLHRNIHNRPKVGNEICFHLTKSGELRYTKNGRECGTIMHVDCSLPMWLFVDIYGTTHQIQSIGVIRRSMLQNGNHGFISSPPRERVSRSAEGARPPPPPTASTTSSSRSRHGRRTLEPGVVPEPSVSAAAATLPEQSNGAVPVRTRPIVPPPVETNSTSSSSRPPISSDSSRPSQSHQRNPVSSNAPNPMSDLLSEPFARLPPPLIPLPVGSDPAVSDDLVVLSDVIAPADSSSSSTSKTKSSRAVSNVECAICLENEPDSALYPCGHMCMCYGCALSVQKQRSALCPMCRQPIVDILRIYRN